MKKLFPYETTRLRIILFIIMSILFVLGILSKDYIGPHRHWFKNYFGDMIFVMFLFFFLKFIFPNLRWFIAGLIDYIGIAALEFAQKIETPWLADMRSGFWGQLILGKHFDTNDFIYYAVGILAAILIYLFLFIVVCRDRKDKPQEGEQLVMDLEV